MPRQLSQNAPSGAWLFDVKFGRNESVTNGGWSPIVSSGTLNFLTAADTVRVKAGGNAADTSAGAGARTVTVVGLNSSWKLDSETLTLAGASASSSSSKSFIRVFRAYVATCGTYGGANTGAIVIESTGGTALLTVPAGDGQSQHCQYTVPDGSSMRIVRVEAQVPSAKDADLRLMVRQNADTVAAPFSPARVVGFRDGIAASDVNGVYAEGLNLPPRTDVWIEAYGNGAGVSAIAEFDFYLITPPVDFD